MREITKTESIRVLCELMTYELDIKLLQSCIDCKEGWQYDEVGVESGYDDEDLRPDKYPGKLAIPLHFLTTVSSRSFEFRHKC